MIKLLFEFFNEFSLSQVLVSCNALVNDPVVPCVEGHQNNEFNDKIDEHANPKPSLIAVLLFVVNSPALNYNLNWINAYQGKEDFVILFSDAVVEPHAVMVESSDTAITVSAMLGRGLNLDFANMTVELYSTQLVFYVCRRVTESGRHSY